MAAPGHRRRRLTLDPIDEFMLISSLGHPGLVPIDPVSDTNSDHSGSEPGPAELELSRLLSFHHETPIDAEAQGDEPFTKIGAGACGAVFARPGKPYAIKLSKTKCHQVLWNDYLSHTKIAQCFRRFGHDEVNVPACHYFAPPDESQFFAQHAGLAEAAEWVCNLPTSALVTERILPLPERIRTLLIDKYCAPHIRGMAKTDAANRDCLARVYLGSTKGKKNRKFFSLRDFKMHLNYMVELQLDIKGLARKIGLALGFIHWGAETDGRGVEFVLGGSSKTTSRGLDTSKLEDVKPLSYTGPSSRTTEDFLSQATETKLWVLDFDQVQPITMDRNGVEQAVEAALLNDPYLPKPLQTTVHEQEAWKAFVTGYLDVANVIFGGGRKANWDLPRRFIWGLISAQWEVQLARSIRARRD